MEKVEAFVGVQSNVAMTRHVTQAPADSTPALCDPRAASPRQLLGNRESRVRQLLGNRGSRRG